MRHKNINHVVHEWLHDLVKLDDIIVDATCGQGFDTLFCLERGAYVHAFDVQLAAIEKTKARCHTYHRLTLHHTSHAFIKNYIGLCHGAIFNLGYLPHSDKSLITTPASTITAFEQVWQCLIPQGWMCVTFYQGHDGGKQELQLGLEWLQQHGEIVKTYTYEGVVNAPIAILVIKK